MESQTFDYADELIDFMEQLLYAGANQFSVAFHKDSNQWAVSYPPGTFPGEDDE